MEFRAMRRTKREIPVEAAKELLRTCKRAAFSVIGDGGYPYTVPVNFVYDEAEGRIYLHGSRHGHKIDAIRACDKVCLSCWEDGTRDEGDWAYRVSSCVVFGRARLVEDPALTEAKTRALALRYYPSSEEAEEELRRDIKGVQLVAIDVEHISGKRIHEK